MRVKIAVTAARRLPTFALRHRRVTPAGLSASTSRIATSIPSPLHRVYIANAKPYSKLIPRHILTEYWRDWHILRSYQQFCSLWIVSTLLCNELLTNLTCLLRQPIFQGLFQSKSTRICANTFGWRDHEREATNSGLCFYSNRNAPILDFEAELGWEQFAIKPSRNNQKRCAILFMQLLIYLLTWSEPLSNKRELVNVNCEMVSSSNRATMGISATTPQE